MGLVSPFGHSGPVHLIAFIVVGSSEAEKAACEGPLSRWRAVVLAWDMKDIGKRSWHNQVAEEVEWVFLGSGIRNHVSVWQYSSERRFDDAEECYFHLTHQKRAAKIFLRVVGGSKIGNTT